MATIVYHQSIYYIRCRNFNLYG